MDSGFKCLDSGFQSLLVFRIPWDVLQIPSSGFQISQAKCQKFIAFWNPDFLLCETISVGSVYWKKVRVSEFDAPVQRAA